MTLELDLTKPVGEVAITTPDGRIVYDLMAITREPMMVFQQLGNLSDADLSEQAHRMMEALAGVLQPQNGGPPALQMLDQMFRDGFLGVNHLRQLADYVMDEAAGGRPPA